jgi:triosephosphate isomerase
MARKTRAPIITGNWKMNLGRAEEALAFVRAIRFRLNEITGVERVLGPPFTVLASLAEVLRPTQIGLAAQTMHWADAGAYTGEISPAMLVGLCQYVILGHSERRTGTVAFPPEDAPASGESDAEVNRKVQAALAHGLSPIICVGENLEQNEAGQTDEFVGRQVRAALQGLEPRQAAQCVIAYEPIWAIGTGKAATPVAVNRVAGITIRGAVAQMFGELTAQAIRLQYGGSVNVGNIADYMAMPELDGALVGGASLTPDFVELVRRAVGAA